MPITQLIHILFSPSTGSEIDPDFEERGMLIMFDNGRQSGLKVKRMLFIEPVTTWDVARN